MSYCLFSLLYYISGMDWQQKFGLHISFPPSRTNHVVTANEWHWVASSLDPRKFTDVSNSKKPNVGKEEFESWAMVRRHKANALWGLQGKWGPTHSFPVLSKNEVEETYLAELARTKVLLPSHCTMLQHRMKGGKFSVLRCFAWKGFFFFFSYVYKRTGVVSQMAYELFNQ